MKKEVWVCLISPPQGSLGLITHDSNYRNIQVTTKQINGKTLIKYNQKRLNGIQDGLKYVIILR